MDKAPEAFRTISEVAEWLGVQPHVLRFWESKFPQIKPVKRAGGRRYYRPSDMRLLGGLKKLLHEDGLTIKGAQKILREQGVRAVQGMAPPLDEDGFDPALPEEMDAAPMNTPAQEGTADPGKPRDPDAAEASEPAPPAEASEVRFADILAQTDPQDAADAQGSLDLPLVQRKPRPLDIPEGTPVPETPVAARKPASPVRTPPPATLFDALAQDEDPQEAAAQEEDETAVGETAAPSVPDTPPDTPPAPVPSPAPAATPEAAAAPAPPPKADAPLFRSRLGGMLTSEAAERGVDKASGPAPQDAAAAPATRTQSLPPADTPLDAALSMLEAGQVPPIRLRPIYDQLIALRARMDAAG